MAGAIAWREYPADVGTLDLDNWGSLVLRLQNGAGWRTLFVEPSMWKGPVVPFAFGVAYLAAPTPAAPVVLNVIAFALAAGCFFRLFTELGAKNLRAAIPIFLWACYRPHHFVFGHYLAEPLLSLGLAVLMLLTARCISASSLKLAMLTGATAGLLLLSRAPFILVVAGYFALIVAYSSRRWLVTFGLAAGFAATFLPWTIRNFVVHHRVIPFTTEAGKILFQGTYVRGDAAIIGGYGTNPGSHIEGTLRKIPEFAALERGAEGMTPIEELDYWRALAMREIRQDPLGQVKLVIRKGLRFWVDLPTNSWVPNWKTTLVAIAFLPAASFAMITRRRELLVQLCGIAVLGLWAVHAGIHSELRYNFPVLPPMFLLGLLGYAEIIRRWRDRAGQAVG